MLTDYDIIEWKTARMKTKREIAQKLLDEANLLEAEIDFFKTVNPMVILNAYPKWLQELMITYGY